MRKSVSGGLIIAAAAASLTLAVPAAVAGVYVNTSPSSSMHFTPTENRASKWGDECYKIEDPATPFHLTESAAILVIKSGTINDVWYDAAPGYYGSASGKQISHVIVCPGGYIS